MSEQSTSPQPTEETTGTSETAVPSDREDQWGYDLYPERRGEAPRPKWWQIAFFGDGRTNIDKVRCERNVYHCFQNSMSPQGHFCSSCICFLVLFFIQVL